LLLFYAYIGFEAVIMTAGETKKPRRTIPNALVRTVIVTATLYFLIMLVYVAVMANESSSGATLADVARKIAGPVGAVTITVAAIFSIGGNLATSMLSGPRLSLSLAEQGLLPQWFGRIHDDYSTPANSIIFLGGISIIIALTGSFVRLAIASSLARLIVYIVCIASLPVIKNKADAETIANSFKIKGGYTIPVIAIGLCVWMASHSSAESWKFLFGLLAVGLVLFWIEKLSTRKSGQET
jgi:amino acid transporter